MDRERWLKIEEIFQEAVELSPNERASFLDEACADDAELRCEVDSLLANDEGDDAFLNTLISEAAKSFVNDSSEKRADLADRRIGPYRICSACIDDRIRPHRLQTAAAERQLGECLLKQSRYEEAEQRFLEYYRVVKAKRGDGHEETRKAADRLAALYAAWNKPEKSAQYR